MPSPVEFPAYMHKYVKEVLDKSEFSVKRAATGGVAYMKEMIEKLSPTSTMWHANKNLANGFAMGARIGSKIDFGGYPADPKSGTMLNSVESGSVTKTESTIDVEFGWVNNKEAYFIKQDTGTYRSGGVGMGLLNAGNRASKDFAASIFASEKLIENMKKAGFSSKGSIA